MTSISIDGEIYASKVEARWGLYFERLGVRASHEPFAVTCVESGVSYIPDFLLPDHRALVEVKFGDVRHKDLERWYACLRVLDRALQLWVVSGDPPGTWYCVFEDEFQVPLTVRSLAMSWQRGYLPGPAHDAGIAASVCRAELFSATEQEQQERRKFLGELSTWEEWLLTDRHRSQ